jgi:hypothetical protein
MSTDASPLNGLDVWWQALTQRERPIGLADRSQPSVDNSEREGRWMRQLLLDACARLQRPVDANVNMVDQLEAHWQKMRDRLQAHGLLGADDRSRAQGPNHAHLHPGAGDAVAASRRIQQKSIWFWGLLAIVAVVCGFLWTQNAPQNQPYAIHDLPIQLRGDEAWKQLPLANPESQAREIEALFKAAGLPVRLEHTSQGILIQAQVPTENTALRERLQALGVRVPGHGRVNLWLLSK